MTDPAAPSLSTSKKSMKSSTPGDRPMGGIITSSTSRGPGLPGMGR